LAPKGAGLIKSEIVLAPKGTSQNFIKISGIISLPFLGLFACEKCKSKVLENFANVNEKLVKVKSTK
jgi:hypothetical protein